MEPSEEKQTSNKRDSLSTVDEKETLERSASNYAKARKSSTVRTQSIATTSGNIRVMKRRFLMLFLFSCCTCLSAIAWIAYSPLFELIQDMYGVSLFSVQFMSYSYMILFLPFNVPSVIALEKYGLRVGVVIGIGLSALGLILKIFIDTSYSFVLIG